MTITPPTVSPVTVDVPASIFRGQQDITPFTYRSGMTYTQLLESIRVWLYNTLVPYLNSNFEDIVGSWEDNVGQIDTTINTALASQAASINTALTTQQQQVANQLATTLNQITQGESAALNDSAVYNALQVANSQALAFLDSRYFTRTTNKQNAITGWFHVRDYGAMGDDTTDDTAAIQAAIAAAVAHKGGTVYFSMPNPGMTYRYEQIVIDSKNFTNRYSMLALVGDAGGVNLRPFRDLTTPSFVITASGAVGESSTTGTGFIENVTLRNLNLTNGYLNAAQTSDTNRVGMSICNAQNIVLDNVTIQGFWKQGLQMLSVEDSKITNLNILWCGHATSDTDYSYGLELDSFITSGGVNNGPPNALQFTNFHIDQCPLEIHIVASTVGPISFVNGKLERQIYTDTTATKNRIWFEDALQVEFTNVHFFEDGATSKYAISSTAPDSSYMTGSNVRRHIAFMNCTFGASGSSNRVSRWATGNYLKFIGCTFNRTDGTNSAGAFTLANGSKIEACEITLGTPDIAVFGITGPNVTIRDVLIQSPSATASNGNLFSFGGAYDGVVVDGIGLSGFFGSYIGGTAPAYLGNGTYNKPQTGSTRSAVTGASVFLAEKINLAPTVATSFVGANFPGGHNGKKIVLQAVNTFSTLTHDQNAMYLKGATNKTLTGGQTVHLYNDQGVWREI